METRITKSNAYDVVISGAGPFGLAAAFELAKAGQSVLIISNLSQKDSSIRMLRLNITRNDRLYLKSMMPKDPNPADQKILDMIKKLSNFAIKDIEQYLQRRLEELRAQGHRIDYKFNSELSEINLFEGTARIRDITEEKESAVTQEVNFTFLIGAEGAKRHAYKLLQHTSQLPEFQEETYEYPEGVLTHHVSSYFILHRRDNQAFELPQKDRSTYIEAGGGAGINLDLNSYYKSNKKQIKAQFVTSYPIEQQETVTAYFKKQLESLLHDMHLPPEEYTTKSTHPSVKHGARKDNLKFSIFQTRRVELNKTAVIVNGHGFLTGGEGAYYSDYRFGEGIPKSFAAARDVKEVVTGTMQVEEYNKKRQQEAEHSKQIIKNLRQPTSDKISPVKNDVPLRNTKITHDSGKTFLGNTEKGPEKIIVKVGDCDIYFKKARYVDSLILMENNIETESLILIGRRANEFAQLIKDNNVELLINQLERYDAKGKKIAARLKEEIAKLSSPKILHK